MHAQHTYMHAQHTYMLNIHTYMLNIHTYMLNIHAYIHTLGGPCLDRPPEAQKIKFRTGSPECFKTIAETKVWTHFLVQAGYLDFGASEASDAEQSCMYV